MQMESGTNGLALLPDDLNLKKRSNTGLGWVTELLQAGMQERATRQASAARQQDIAARMQEAQANVTAAREQAAALREQAAAQRDITAMQTQAGTATAMMKSKTTMMMIGAGTIGLIALVVLMKRKGAKNA